jgi:hypothetical protein
LAIVAPLVRLFVSLRVTLFGFPSFSWVYFPAGSCATMTGTSDTLPRLLDHAPHVGHETGGAMDDGDLGGVHGSVRCAKGSCLSRRESKQFRGLQTALLIFRRTRTAPFVD